MSSLDLGGSSRPRRHRGSRFVATAAVLAAALLLGGCFRPLYGPTASGVTVQDQLAAVDVVITPRASQERLIHYVENELNFDLNGSGTAPTKQYRLEMTLTEQLVTSSVNQTTGQAVAAILTIIADYKLVSSTTGATLISGQARASAGYDRTPQRFQDVRAARDALIRASKVLAEQLKTKLAAHFASRP
jgi:LPS-assembly lipoprotein